MSKRISHVINVLKYVSARFGNVTYGVHLRMDACESIAVHEQITKNTVIDGITRQLQLSTADFDIHCSNWLVHNSPQLQAIILRHTIDDYDVTIVNAFFSEYYQDLDLTDNAPDVVNTPETYREGRQKYITHLTKERNRVLIRNAKAHWLNIFGDTLRCSVCSFSFFEKYGEWGLGFIEAHHTTPLAELEVETETTIDSLAPVCANCHRMIHRTRPWLSVDELRIKVNAAAPRQY